MNLAQDTNTPVFYSPKFSNALPHDHPLRGGPASNLAMLRALGEKQPDFIFLIGARTGFLLGGRGGAILPNDDCKFVQVDVDGSEIGKSHAIDVGIVADGEQTVAAMLLGFKNAEYKAPKAWAEKAGSLKKKRSFDDAPLDMSPGRPHPYHAIKTLFSSLRPGAIVCIDGGECGGWSMTNIEHARASRAIVSTGYLGFLGNGWGYALGAALADPSRQVVNIQGDGSAGFHIAELDTYARFKLNILTVVVNNYCWGMSKAGQDLIYGDKTPLRQASKLSSAAAYETVAAGLQCASQKVDSIGDIEKAVQALSAAGKPALLNLIVSEKPIHPGTKAMVNVTESTDWIVVPYYDNIPRPFYRT